LGPKNGRVKNRYLKLGTVVYSYNPAFKKEAETGRT
jgi:hypothetical protein